MLKSEIDLLTGKIRQETEHYYEAITRKKDFTAARNIRQKINSLNKNLNTTVQMLSNGSAK